MRLSLLVILTLAASAAAAGPAFRIDQTEKDYISVFEGSKPVFRYVRGEVLAPGVPENRRRSTYVDLVYSLDGVPLSEDFPKDHHHHRGMSWMWLKVTFDGVTKDLWTLKGIHQRYFSHEAQALSDRAILKVRNGWFEDSTDRKIIDEAVTLTAYPADAAGRLIDFELHLAAVDTHVSLGVSNTGYSGLQIRFAAREDTIITTPKGLVTGNQDRKRYAWADLSARFGGLGDYDGIAIFDHPSNPHFPCGWTLRPYGVLNAAFTSTSADYTIEPGKPLTLRYRVYVHKGRADTNALYKLERAFHNRG